MTDKLEFALGKDPRRIGMLTLADHRDADAFAVGTQMWSPDGRRWYHGDPPAELDTASHVMCTIESIDAESGVITFSGAKP
jgi:hypothetical protein